MVSIGAGGFSAIAVAVYVVWRIICWRRAGGDAVREFVVGVLFAYVLAMACVAFFPMTIIFYDWHGRFNLVPLASIIDLVQHATSSTALKNIGGNIVMFVPLGFLLPLLVRKLRSAGSLICRVAIISAAIEILQLPTRVRATDVDDIILNVIGAVLGYAVFRLFVLLAKRLPRVEAFIDRVGSHTQREPLLTGLSPTVVTIVLTVALIVPPILTNTLDERAIREDVVSGMVDASVAARADAGEYVFLVAKSGEATSEAFRYTAYKRVLPGRYTKMVYSRVYGGDGSRYMTGCTSWNPRAGERPVMYVAGRNDSGASTVVLKASRGTVGHVVPIGRYFVVALPNVSLVDNERVTVAFHDASGRDVTKLFKGQ